MTAYDDLPDAEQVDLLTDVARAAAPRFGLDPASVALVAHAYNTTFAATGPDGRVALRIHTNSHSTPAHVRAQHHWVRHLAAHGVRVPAPVPTRAGEDLTEVETGVRRWTVTAATWLDGPDLATIDGRSADLLGRLTARMHDLAEGYALPEHAELPTYDEPLFGDDNLLEHWPGWSPADQEVIAEAFARTRAVHTRLASQSPTIPCHADLYAPNLKRTADGLAVFDFDDMGLTAPAVDLATTIFHVRGQPSSGEVEAALLSGYVDTRPLPPGAIGSELEALVASRQLLLTNSLLASSTGSMRARVAGELTATVTRLRTWLTTGRFEIHPPG